MDKTLRDCFKGIAYMHYHPEDKYKKILLDKLLSKAWDMGYPNGFFKRTSELTDEIKIEDMTEWEVKYVIDIPLQG